MIVLRQIEITLTYEYEWAASNEDISSWWRIKRRLFFDDPAISSGSRHIERQLVCEQNELDSRQKEVIEDVVKTFSPTVEYYNHPAYNLKITSPVVKNVTIKSEIYVKELPVSQCLELLTPKQFAQEFGYLFREGLFT